VPGGAQRLGRADVRRQRHPEVGADAGLNACESLRRDADDLKLLMVAGEPFADDAGVGTEAAPPEAVAQHSHAMRTGRSLVAGQQETSDGWRQAKLTEHRP
jgi:hypothetical protein